MLQRVVTVLSGLALLCMGAGAALAVNVAQFGALNTRPGGASPQDTATANILSTLGFAGLALLIVSAVFCVSLALRSGQWLWALALVALTIGGLYAYGNAGFNGDVFSSLLSLIAPLACLVFALQHRASTARASQRG